MKDVMEITHEGKIFHLAWSFDLLEDMEPGLMLSSLSEQERKTAKSFPVESRSREFAAGRFCAKQAFDLFAPGIAQQNVTIGIGVWGYPFIAGSDANISIAHTGNYVVAVCTDGAFPVGVDIEDRKSSNDSLILSQLTDTEKKLAGIFPDHSEGLHILWAAKEAAAKALRTGFRLPMWLFEVSAVARKQDAWRIKFDTFGVLSVIAVSTAPGVLALALPAGSVVVKGFEAFFMAEYVRTR